MWSILKQTRELLLSIWRMRPYFRGGRYLIGAVVATSLIAAMLEGAAVALLVPLLSVMIGGEQATPMRPLSIVQSWFPERSPGFYVVIFCLIVLAAIACKNAVHYISQFLAAKLKARILVNLRQSLFTRLHGADLSLFDQRPAGELANTFIGEVSRTLAAIDILLLFGQRASIGFFYFVALLVISLPLTLFTICLAVIIGAVVSSVQRRIARGGAELTGASQKLNAFVLQSFAGIRVVRATNSQGRELARFQELNEYHARVDRRALSSNALLLPVAETVAVTGGMLIVGVGYLFFVQPKLMLNSHLMGFSVILLRLLPLMNQLYSLQGYLFYLAGAIKEVGRWLDSPQHPARSFGSRIFEGVQHGIKLDNVSYVFANRTAALKQVSFEIPSGKTVALVGASGAGKTTIASLLLRFRYPTEGKILVDGTDHWDFSPASWHENVALVEQEAFLFHDTMANNIGYGFPKVSREALDRAIHIAHLGDVIAALPDGLDTIVGERGMMLSGGQRQRLAIARAVVRDPKVLILDEATSSLDSVSERQVQAALAEAQQGRTVIVIAHRLSTIRDADHIVVLGEGRVLEQGTWQELESRSGAFKALLASAELRG